MILEPGVGDGRDARLAHAPEIDGNLVWFLMGDCTENSLAPGHRLLTFFNGLYHVKYSTTESTAVTQK